MTKILCVACGEWISTVNLDALSLPLNGAMFPSPRPENGFPAPFDLDPTRFFGDLKCPVCHNNATEEDAVWTPEGRIVVTRKEEETVFVLNPETVSLQEAQPVELVQGDMKQAALTGIISEEPTECPVCHKPVKGLAGLYGHKRHCKGAKA